MRVGDEAAVAKPEISCDASYDCGDTEKCSRSMDVNVKRLAGSRSGDIINGRTRVLSIIFRL